MNRWIVDLHEFSGYYDNSLSIYTKECKLLWEKLGRKILEKGGNYEKNSIRLWYGNIQCFSTCGYLFLYFYSKLLFRTNLWHKIFHQFVYFSRYIIANGNIINGKSYWRFIVIMRTVLFFLNGMRFIFVIRSRNGINQLFSHTQSKYLFQKYFSHWLIE